MNRHSKARLKQRIYAILYEEKNEKTASGKIADLIEIYVLDLSSKIKEYDKKLKQEASR